MLVLSLFELCTYFRSVMSKPREFAHLIKNKFGSADNINTMTTTSECISCYPVSCLLRVSKIADLITTFPAVLAVIQFGID